MATHQPNQPGQQLLEMQQNAKNMPGQPGMQNYQPPQFMMGQQPMMMGQQPMMMGQQPMMMGYNPQMVQMQQQNQFGMNNQMMNIGGNQTMMQKQIEEQKLIERNKKRAERLKQQKFPRPDLPENNEKNLELGGSYQSCIYYLGECCGCLRTFIPCICCVEYPYQQVNQGEEGIFERFGKYVKIAGPGLHQINPCTDRLIKINMKTQLIDLKRQWAITKDNVLINIDATVYYKVDNSRMCFYSVKNIQQAVSELTFATLRSVIGQYTLQEVLGKRQELSQMIEEFVEEHSWDWGIDITNMVMTDIQMSQELQDTLSSAAKERRLAESKIISAKADVASAKLQREAADILDSKAAMQIRYLEVVKQLGQYSKVIMLGDEEDSTQ